MRTRVLRIVMVLATLLTLSGVATAQEGDLSEQLRETRKQLEDRRNDLERTKAEQAEVAEKIRASDAELARLTQDLRAAEAQLTAAAAVEEEARAASAEATRRLQIIGERLEQTRLRLQEREQAFDSRIAATYKYGNVSYAQALMGADDVADFLNTMYYVRSVMRADRAIISDVTDATRALAEDRAEADLLRDDLRRQEQRAVDARRESERLAEAAKRLADMVAEERDHRARLLAQLEVEEALTAQEIDELEAESEELAEKLRASRWRAGAPGAGTFVWPTSGQVTSPYGYRTHPIYGGQRLHAGVDISGSYGQPIVAANDGLVLAAYCSSSGYGCRTVIDHGGGVATLYAHQSRFQVGEGTEVSAGQVVGYVGSTGASTGPHLHFEIRINGTPTDPMPYY